MDQFIPLTIIHHIPTTNYLGFLCLSARFHRVSALFAPNPLYVLLGSSYHCEAFLFACSHSNITYLLLTGVKIVVKDILKLFQVLRCSSIKRNDRHVHLNNQIIAKKATNNTFHTASVFFGTCREDTTGLLLYSQIFGVIREHAKSEGKKKG